MISLGVLLDVERPRFLTITIIVIIMIMIIIIIGNEDVPMQLYAQALHSFLLSPIFEYSRQVRLMYGSFFMSVAGWKCLKFDALT